MGAMLSIQALVRHFGPLRAVDGVSFEVDRGEVLGFLGPNGAGKSTTMKMITGFLPPTSGVVVVCGRDTAVDPIGAKERIGYLPEGAPAYSDMSTRAFLRFAAEVRGLTGTAARERIAEVARRVRIEGVLGQRVETLSKGYRRRVGIAQAILHDPEVLVLDEPTDGLDPNQKHEMRGLIREMSAEKAIIISTHILEEVDAVCTRAVIIDAGKIVFDGSPRELEQRSRLYGAVTLALRPTGEDGERERVLEELRGLPGVAGVEDCAAELGLEGRICVRALAERGQALGESIGLFSVERGWQVDELHTERGRLDEVFRSLTRDEVQIRGGAA